MFVNLQFVIVVFPDHTHLLFSIQRVQTFGTVKWLKVNMCFDCRYLIL